MGVHVRRVTTVDASCRLFEFDFSGIEARLVGYFARGPKDDATYYRLAGLGPHAYVASHLIGKPADLRLPDAELVQIFKAIKKGHQIQYDKAKRTVHGNGYGMTHRGMYLMFPDLYASEKDAKRTQDVFFACAPTVPAWQSAMQQLANDQTYVGGVPAPGKTILTDLNAHPYGYRHEFYSVVAYRPLGPRARAKAEAERLPIVEINGKAFVQIRGEDAKRVLAFFPQSSAAGILKEVLLALFAYPDAPSYIGDAYFGRTPLRAPIHDSLLLELPRRAEDRVLEHVFREMLRPVEEMPLPAAWHARYGAHLTVGVEAKCGVNWEDVEAIPTPKFAELGLSNIANELTNDRTYFPPEEIDEDEVEDLMTKRGVLRAFTSGTVH
jgi:hypothetical protein